MNAQLLQLSLLIYLCYGSKTIVKLRTLNESIRRCIVMHHKRIDIFFRQKSELPNEIIQYANVLSICS